MKSMKKNKTPTESQEQQRLVLKLRWLFPELVFFAVPNGGARQKSEAARMKLEGVEKGIPDIFIAQPQGVYHGLFIELKKRVKSKTSAEQNKKIEDLRAKGYAVFVCFGAEEALEVIKEYINI